MNMATKMIQTTTLSIDGMTCGACVQAVTNALTAVPGVTVKSVAVGSAAIEAADGWAAGDAVNALDAAGYPAKAIGDGAPASTASPAKSGGGCCGGARSAAVDHSRSAKSPGGCCG